MQQPINHGIVFSTDSYKFGGHWKMLRPGTTLINSYLESRGGRFPKTILFGLQYIIKRYMTGVVVTPEQVEKAREFAKFHFGTDEGFNYDGWMYIAKELGGKLPLEIKAVPEGTLVKTSNILINVKNTDDKCAWLTGYIESLLMKIWYPTTIASNGFYLKLLLAKSYIETSDNMFLDFSMHDFGYRSVTTEEQAQIGGGSHLLNFKGTDNIQGILWVQDWYNPVNFPGYSVYASEHMISTAFGKGLGEKEYVLFLLKTFPKGKLSVVADTYDIYKFTHMLCDDNEIKELILSRAPDDTFVVRPDSGNPPEVISKLLNILWNGFGGTYNNKGYKVLNSAIRIIQGDGIDFSMTSEILHMMNSNKYAVDNLVFGSGSALLNKNFDRDTQKFAFKASYIIINGETINVQKDPITSSGKKSKTGELKLTPLQNGGFMTISSNSYDSTIDSTFHSYIDALRVVFLNGELIVEDNFETIRERVEGYFKSSLKEEIDFTQF